MLALIPLFPLLGFVINGWGSRLAMMLLAGLNPDATGLTSDDGFRIGQFTLGDTMGLVAFATILGVVGGLVYLAIRPLRFGPPAFALTALTVGPAVVVGNMLVHTDGIDFRALEPAWLAIGLFVALPGVFSLSMALLVERWLRPEAWFGRARFPRVAVTTLPLGVLWPLLIPTAGVLLARRVGGRPQAVDSSAARSTALWLGRALLMLVFAVSLGDLVRKTLELT